MNRNIFGIDIYEAEMPNFDRISNDIINKVVPTLLEPDIKDHESQRGGSRSNYYKVNFQLHKDIDISPVSEFILSQAKIYWDHLKYSKRLTPKILNTWANITPPGGHWETHIHSPAPIAGAFYLNAKPGMGNIVFEHPLETLLACQPFEFDLEPRHYDFVAESKTGKLILFPGWMKHRTQVNHSNEPRLVIGVNIGCEGTVSYTHLI